MSQHRNILDVLKNETHGFHDAFMLSSRFGIPAPSVRRAIGTLRAAGHNIKLNSLGSYKFIPPAASSATMGTPTNA